MKENNRHFPSRLSLIGKWLVVTTLGWAISTLVVGGAYVHSWPEWQALVASYFLNGALIGAIVGLGQARILGSLQVPLLKWTLVTLMAYTIGLPASVVLASGITFWLWPADLPMLAGLPGTFMIIGLSQAALGGAVVGLVQWLVLRGRVVPATRRGGLLWILGNVSGLGIGGFLATILDGLTWLGYFSFPVGQLAARIMVGAILGLITGTILVILHQPEQFRPLTPTTARVQ